MKLFGEIGNEEKAPVEDVLSLEGFDALDGMLSVETYDAEQLAVEMRDSLGMVTVANEAIENINKIIAMDKVELANEALTVSYVQMSNESFKQALNAVGYPVETLKMATEDTSAMTPVEMLTMSIEEKELAVEGIASKIKDKLKAIGTAFKNFGKLMRTAFKNDLNLVKELKAKIKISTTAKDGELDGSSKNTVQRLTRHLLPFTDLKSAKDGEIIKLLEEMSDVAHQGDNMDTATDNLKAMIAADYDPEKVKLKPFKATNDTHAKIMKAVEANSEVPADKIILVYFSNALPLAAVANYLYTTDKKPNIITAATKIGNTSIKLKSYDHKDLDVDLYKLATLDKILDVAAANVKTSNDILSKLINFYDAGDAIGDISPAIFAQHMWEYSYNESIFFRKGTLHMANVMLANYKQEK